MCSFYTIRRSVETSQRITDNCTVSYVFNLLCSVRSHVCLHNLQPSYSKRSHSSYFSQTSHLSFFFSLHCSCWKIVCRTKMLLIVHTRRAVSLNYGLNRHKEYIRQKIYIIYHLDCIVDSSVAEGEFYTIINTAIRRS